MAIFYWARWKKELKEVCCIKNIPNDCYTCKNRFICYTSFYSVIRRPSELEREYFPWDNDIHRVSRL